VLPAFMVLRAVRRRVSRLLSFVSGLATTLQVIVGGATFQPQRLKARFTIST
jgi:hypothetical protein